MDLAVDAKGDLEVDLHHTVEDVGICLGKAFKDALGDKVRNLGAEDGPYAKILYQEIETGAVRG